MPDGSQSGIEVQEQKEQNSARIRVLAFMEASTVTGPAKNLIEFARLSAVAGGDRPGVDLSVATFVRNPDRPNAFVDAVRQAGIPLHIIRESSPIDFRAVRQMKDLVRTLKPDIIQSHNFKAHFLVRFSGLHRKYCWVAFQHGYTWTDLKNRIYNQFDRWSLPAADRVVTVCRPFAKHLAGRGVSAERITVQHNSVRPFVSPSTEQLDSLRRELNIRSSDRVVLTVGRLSREKGHRDLLEAFPLVKSNSGKLLLVIVGDGHERQLLQAQAQRLGIADRVIVV
ncbi:MAG TPA: glycosyltransferase, partial [Terriglobales bacterium]